VIAIASTAFSAYQGIRAGKAAKKAGQLEQAGWNDAARTYEWNAKLAELQADDAINRGEVEAERYQSQVDQFIGTQRAGFAGAGVDVNWGSPVDVVADTAYLGSLDKSMIRNNALREAWGYRTESVDSQMRAIIAKRSGVQAAEAGRQAARSAYWAVGGQLLGAGTSLLQAKYGFKPRNSSPSTPNARLGANAMVYG
jgi:hypothetical protein